MSLPNVIMIDKPSGVEKIARRLKSARRFTVDTESNSLYVYREEVCFVQIGCEDDVFLLDTIAVRNLDALKPFFADPAITKVLHGADYDVSCMGRDFDMKFAGLFDTHVAAHLVGHERLGLASLVQHYFGIELDKSKTTHDWGRRPLDPSYIDYLVDDVVYLEELNDILARELLDHEVEEEAEIEFRRVCRQKWSRPEVDPEGFRRIKGSAGLDRIGLSILKQLYLWREARASELNRPPFRVLGNQQLLKISETRPRLFRDLARNAGLHPRNLERNGRDLLAAVTTGLRDWRTVPLKGAGKGVRPAAEDTAAQEALREWRRDEAKKRGTPSIVVLPNYVIDQIVAERPTSIDELATLEGVGQNRTRRYGKQILAILRKHGQRPPKARRSAPTP